MVKQNYWEKLRADFEGIPPRVVGEALGWCFSLENTVVANIDDPMVNMDKSIKWMYSSPENLDFVRRKAQHIIEGQKTHRIVHVVILASVRK